jgi:hypothetical protein
MYCHSNYNVPSVRSGLYIANIVVKRFYWLLWVVCEYHSDAPLTTHRFADVFSECM